MVTTNAESLHLIGILLRYMPKKIAWKMLVDMTPEELVGDRESFETWSQICLDYLLGESESGGD